MHAGMRAASQSKARRSSADVKLCWMRVAFLNARVTVCGGIGCASAACAVCGVGQTVTFGDAGADKDFSSIVISSRVIFLFQGRPFGSVQDALAPQEIRGARRGAWRRA